jgi:DUF4097 and DUF4098 domain-containing protein YvlB
MKTTLFVGLLLHACLMIQAQTHTEKITREFTFEKISDANALQISNINGNVTVQGYDGDKILVEVTKTVSAKTQTRLDKGKQNLKLGTMDRADTIILYVDGTCQTFGKNNRPGKHQDRTWDYQWNNKWNNRDGEDCEDGYDYKLDFVVKVPSRINVQISTINEGDVSVAGVKGAVNANNINGSIKLQNLMREAKASTINGNVDIEYAANPKKDCRFYSLNGDINAWFQKGLAANLAFESFNGDLYTNLDKLEELPVQIEKGKDGEGLKMKVSGNRYKANGGGILLDFETFNGNVYLKEK